MISDYGLDLTGLTHAWIDIVSESKEAVSWFHVGLNWYWGFQMEESLRCFRVALEHDPTLAMAHWGAALVQGEFSNSSSVHSTALSAY